MRKAFDFETKPIENHIPPKPVGVAVSGTYYAFGHPTGNNSTWEEARAKLAELWDQPNCAHNSPFDIGVAMHWFDFKFPPKNADTMTMAYLDNPHAPTLALKWLSQSVLKIPNKEQQDLYGWIRANVPEAKRVGDKELGKFISLAPGDMVAPYAAADTLMTEKLFSHYIKKLERLGMIEALRRELALQPILMGMTKRGIRVNRTDLEVDSWDAQTLIDKLDKKIWARLGDFDINSGAQLGKILVKARVVDERLLPRTEKTDKPSTAGKNLMAAARTPEDLTFLKTISYRKNLYKLLNTYMIPWLQKSAIDGRIHPQYHATRTDEESGGTRTGRLSSSDPNIQNVPVPKDAPEGMPALPSMRAYLLPEIDTKWMVADFSGQEPRLAAHFAGGNMRKQYVDDPEWKIYEYGMERIKNEYGTEIDRKPFKTIQLGIMYGMGAKTLKKKLYSDNKLDIDVETAGKYKKLVLGVFPDMGRAIKAATNAWAAKTYIETLGGRKVYGQPPSGSIQWDYKAFNMQIQGSAADQTKSLIIEFDKEFPGQLLTTVHDEVDPWFHPDQEKQIKEFLSSCANTALPCSIPMLMDFCTGNNWAEATD